MTIHIVMPFMVIIGFYVAEIEAINRTPDELNNLMRLVADSMAHDFINDRDDWTRDTVAELCRQDSDYLWLVVKDDTWNNSDRGGLITSIHYELGKSGVVETTWGFAIACFHNSAIPAWFVRNGDGGFINWAYSCGWSRDGTRIYHP